MQLKFLKSLTRLARKKGFKSGLLLGLFLFLQAAVTSPVFHSVLHSDATDPAHQCAVTMFSHGQVDAATPAVAIVVAQPLVSFASPTREVTFVSTDIRLQPGRGPPAAA